MTSAVRVSYQLIAADDVYRVVIIGMRQCTVILHSNSTSIDNVPLIVHIHSNQSTTHCLALTRLRSAYYSSFRQWMNSISFTSRSVNMKTQIRKRFFIQYSLPSCVMKVKYNKASKKKKMNYLFHWKSLSPWFPSWNTWNTRRAAGLLARVKQAVHHHKGSLPTVRDVESVTDVCSAWGEKNVFARFHKIDCHASLQTAAQQYLYDIRAILYLRMRRNTHPDSTTKDIRSSDHLQSNSNMSCSTQCSNSTGLRGNMTKTVGGKETSEGLSYYWPETRAIYEAWCMRQQTTELREKTPVTLLKSLRPPLSCFLSVSVSRWYIVTHQTILLMTTWQSMSPHKR